MKSLTPTTFRNKRINKSGGKRKIEMFSYKQFLITKSVGGFNSCIDLCRVSRSISQALIKGDEQ